MTDDSREAENQPKRKKDASVAFTEVYANLVSPIQTYSDGVEVNIEDAKILLNQESATCTTD